MKNLDGLILFLSTPSARRATATRRALLQTARISIHALREEGDFYLVINAINIIKISIHALREEGDVARYITYIGGAGFLSTPSARRATLD